MRAENSTIGSAAPKKREDAPWEGGKEQMQRKAFGGRKKINYGSVKSKKTVAGGGKASGAVEKGGVYTEKKFAGWVQK